MIAIRRTGWWIKSTRWTRDERTTGERDGRAASRRPDVRRRATRLTGNLFVSSHAIDAIDDCDDVDVDDDQDGWEKMRGLARERASERRRRG